MTHTAGSLANALDAQLIGDAQAAVTGVASLSSAGPRDLVFVEDAKWLPQALDSAAGVILVGPFAAETTIPLTKAMLMVEHPRLAFCHAAALVRAAAAGAGSVHATAVVPASAKLGAGVEIGAYAVLGEGVVIGAGSRIGAHCVLASGTVMGAGCELGARVTVYEGVRMGDRVVAHSGAVLGSDGFGFVRDGATGRYHKFPQIGRLEIGDDVEIGANTTIDRGALDATVIGNGVKLDNLVHIGHNVRLGENVVIAAQTGISGSTVIERDALIGGQVGIGDHARIGEGVILGSGGGVLSKKVLRGKGEVFWGTPAKPLREYLKELAVLARLAKKS